MSKLPLIRAFNTNDKPALLELLRLNTPAYFSPQEEKDFIHYLDNERDYYYVVELNATIIGCGGINFSSEEALVKISWDILHPSAQGKGIGSQLLQFRIQKIKELQPTTSIIVRTSQHAFQFYEKNGFILKETVKDYWAKGFDLYSMFYQDFV